MTGRPVVYDLTYVATRLHAPTPTGIERIDAAFAAHFTGPAAAGGAAAGDPARAVHYGLAGPHRLGGAAAARLVTEAATVWHPPRGGAHDPVGAAVTAWLQGPPRPLRLAPARLDTPVAHRLARLRWRLHHQPGAAVPRGALYLNVAQYAFEYPWFFRWLARRPDVRPVLFVHDLLPLDHPELFRDGYRALFDRRIATVARVAHAALVSTTAVAVRLGQEMARRGRPDLPIFTAPLPPPATPQAAEPPGGATPYFLMIGTVEPRKNHLLVLNAWRDMAARQAAGQGGPVPRLVLVGSRGWENEQVVDLLDRCEGLRPHVAEVSGLSTPALAGLIAGARAVLLPSFAEGYGLPLAEALAAGTPAIASDIAVFREVSQGCALLLDPTDGPAWGRAVQAYGDSARPHRTAAVAAAAGYRAPTWPAYFSRLEAFLRALD